jgi:hypothetical protein
VDVETEKVSCKTGRGGPEETDKCIKKRKKTNTPMRKPKYCKKVILDDVVKVETEKKR